jgi:hypothetical protein
MKAQQDKFGENKGVGEPVGGMPRNGKSSNEMYAGNKGDSEPPAHGIEGDGHPIKISHGNKIGKHSNSHHHNKFLHHAMPDGY